MIQNQQTQTKKQLGLAKKSENILDEAEPVSHEDG